MAKNTEFNRFRRDTPPTAGLVIGLLVYCAIVALRGDTPPTAGTPKNTSLKVSMVWLGSIVRYQSMWV